MLPSLMDPVALIKMCAVHEELITTHSWKGHIRKKNVAHQLCLLLVAGGFYVALKESHTL